MPMNVAEIFWQPTGALREQKKQSVDKDTLWGYVVDKSYILNKIGSFSESLENLSKIKLDSLSEYQSLRFKKIYHEATEWKEKSVNSKYNNFYSRSGKFYPFVSLSSEDTLKYPINVGAK